jgi:hypothetical protein|uniref:Uncharacterized protein n=1 Tax=Podoviridae sp. ctZ5d16 TaxID=2825257 RepID=A0A8S5Q9P2_9CAUD|nr:MAG TPA: hypothetical protein [Podoviridae sp. ctZ5d16]
MSGLGGINFSLPDISGTDFSKEKEIKELKSYMALLTKQLQFTLANLEPEENFTEETNERWNSLVTDGYVTSEISQSADEILLKVSKEFTTNEVMESKIQQTAEKILLEVSETYAEAGEVSSKIEQKANSILLQVSQTYVGKDELESKIQQTADNILLEVSGTYATDDEVAKMKSSIDQTINAINLTVSKKVGNDEIISKINQSAEQITIQASKINLNGITFADEIRVRDTSEGTICAIRPGRLELGAETKAGKSKDLTVDGTNGIKIRGLQNGQYSNAYTQITEEQILIRHDSTSEFIKLVNLTGEAEIRMGRAGSDTYTSILKGVVKLTSAEGYPRFRTTIGADGITIEERTSQSSSWKVIDHLGKVWVEG